MGYDYRVLDLFAGLGGFSAAFADSERWGVTTVEINGEFDQDIQADVFDLRPSDFDAFDVVLASPPCTRIGKMALCNGYFDGDEPDHPEARDHVALAYHALGLIHGISPTYWFIENPPGKLRNYFGDPTGTVTYCQYGTEYQKRTHLWGDHPPMTYRSCVERQDCHISTPRSDDRHPSDSIPSDSSEASKVPRELSEAIRDACERGLDGDGQEQAALGDW
jgi:hypothetical protein